jgi:hypothetical protein
LHRNAFPIDDLVPGPGDLHPPDPHHADRFGLALGDGARVELAGDGIVRPAHVIRAIKTALAPPCASVPTCFTPESGHQSDITRCPLSAISEPIGQAHLPTRFFIRLAQPYSDEHPAALLLFRVGSGRCSVDGRLAVRADHL